MDYETIDRKYPCHAPLGALWSRTRTVFRIWAPCAESVWVQLYDADDADAPFVVLPMRKSCGVWEAAANGDLHGIYYTYRIRTDGVEQETPDLFAMACGVNGQRSMIVQLSRTDPEGWENSCPVRLDSPADAVICEVHVRDFSADASGGFRNRGKYLAFTEEHVTNSAGDQIGLAYLESLGVTHIHLLPVMDFASVDEADAQAGFNWGYDPVQYFTPEGSYATDAGNGAVRIRELKSLILAAHRHHIGVILDVVYNHTYALEESPFSRTFPGYFYRHDGDGYANGSGCGNEIASERMMMCRIIVESLCRWAQEYKLDGFRFDLMGLLDMETLQIAQRRLRQINPEMLLYGEGWTGGVSPLPEAQRAVKQNARLLPGFAFFSDDFRDSVKGNVFNDTAQGFSNGNPAKRDPIKKALCGGISHPDAGIPPEECWTDTPLQSVNYVEAHDNLTFRDKLFLSMPGAEEERLLLADKMGAALVFFSQGIPFFQAGQEWFRSKPLPDGTFDHNSYRSPDSVNALRWDQVTRYRELVDYYRGCIAIRRKFPEFRLRDAEAVRRLVRFAELDNGALCVEIDRFRLFLNPGDQELQVSLQGEVYADGERACDAPLYQAAGEVCLAPGSLLLIRAEDAAF